MKFSGINIQYIAALENIKPGPSKSSSTVTHFLPYFQSFNQMNIFLGKSSLTNMARISINNSLVSNFLYNFVLFLHWKMIVSNCKTIAHF